MSKHNHKHKHHGKGASPKQTGTSTGTAPGKPAGSPMPAPAAPLTLTGSHVWRFEALDTWFFRESRPLDAIGGAQLTSHFPPPARTLIGAIRTTLGDAQYASWDDYRRCEEHPLRKLIGSPDDLGPLRFTGPYPMKIDPKDTLKGHQRLYPAPLILMCSSTTDANNKTTHKFTRLEPGITPVTCDLGHVRLPVKKDATLAGAKPLEGQWLTAAGLAAVLKGNDPAEKDVVKADALFEAEPRLGIALDPVKRRPLDGLLYQTRHLRLHDDIAVGITLTGLDRTTWPNAPLAFSGLARLGGEGRPTAWHCENETPLPKMDSLSHGHRRLMLCLLGHARFENGWLPDGFEPETDAEGRTTGWRGTLADRPARLVCAVTGKPVREGGWDLAGERSRDLRALVPAGSCYFLEFDKAEDARAVAAQCHGSQIGLDTAWGGGQVVIGQW